LFDTFTPTDLCGMFQIKVWATPFNKLRVEKVKMLCINDVSENG